MALIDDLLAGPRAFEELVAAKVAESVQLEFKAARPSSRESSTGTRDGHSAKNCRPSATLRAG